MDIARLLFWNKNQAPPWHSPQSTDALLQRMEGSRIDYLQTIDKVVLRVIFAPTNLEGERRSVVIFHGRENCPEDFIDLAAWYHRRNFNVLLTSFRGYPLCEGDSVKDGEVGAILDSDGAISFLKERVKGLQNSEILAHGVSLGGAYAAIGAHLHDIHLTLDHAFTNTGDVITSLFLRPFFFLPSPLLTAVDLNIRLLVDTIFPKNVVVHTTLGERLTDGLDNLAKIHNLSSALFIIYGKNDELMPTSFAERFYRSRYGEEPLFSKDNCNVLEMEGGHMGLISDVGQEIGSRKYEQFLINIGLMNARKG